jgi:hypothetical protein
VTDEIMPAAGIHIHEDDWGMRCLHPLAAAAEVTDEIRVARAAGEANRAPDGAGWTDVHIIQQPQRDYAAIGLTLDQAAAALAPVLPRIRRFAATAMAGFGAGAHDPYGSYEQDAHCYGFDAGCFIKVDGDELVRQIWFNAETDDAARLEKLRQAIVAIDRLVPSIIADYWLDRTGKVGDSAFLHEYLRALASPDGE